MKKVITLRTIDRFVIGLLAALVAASGLYLVGPWYLETRGDGSTSPVYYLTNNVYLLRAIGGGMVLAAVGLFWSVTRTAGVVRACVLSYSLLAAFLLRFFTLMGTLLTLESWRPPGYASATFSVLVAGVYWIWVRRNEGTIR